MKAKVYEPLFTSSESQSDEKFGPTKNKNYKFVSDNIIYIDHDSVHSTRERFEDLMKYIYYHCRLNHDKMDHHYRHVGAINSYDFTEDENNDYCYDPDFEFFNNSKPDGEYFYDHEPTLIDDDDSFYKQPGFINQIVKASAKYDLDNIYFHGIDKIIIDNLRGINEDVRGVRRADWKLYFWGQYSIKSESISLHDFIVACYKIKSHKFERWYEMFCRVDSINIDPSVDQNKTVRLGAKFDHGS